MLCFMRTRVVSALLLPRRCQTIISIKKVLLTVKHWLDIFFIENCNELFVLSAPLDYFFRNLWLIYDPIGRWVVKRAFKSPSQKLFWAAFHSTRFSHIIYVEKEWNEDDGRRIDDAKRRKINYNLGCFSLSFPFLWMKISDMFFECLFDSFSNESLLSYVQALHD
jgi:hypothetical protein